MKPIKKVNHALEAGAFTIIALILIGPEPKKKEKKK
jgi:hypothetical protein